PRRGGAWVSVLGPRALYVAPTAGRAPLDAAGCRSRRARPAAFGFERFAPTAGRGSASFVPSRFGAGGSRAGPSCRRVMSSAVACKPPGDGRVRRRAANMAAVDALSGRGPRASPRFAGAWLSAGLPAKSNLYLARRVYQINPLQDAMPTHSDSPARPAAGARLVRVPDDRDGQRLD